MTGILIAARLGSSRLPGKHLMPAAGHALIHWLCRRMLAEFAAEQAAGKVRVIIATSELPGNEPLQDAVKDLPVDVFFGPDANIPLRQLHCAEAFGASEIISVDGDDILCSFRAARAVYEALQHPEEQDIVRTEGLALGMNVSGWSTEYLRRSMAVAQGDRFETGWGRVFRDPRVRTIRMGDVDLMGDLRFTLDYPEDADFFRTIIEGLGEAVVRIKDDALVSHVERHGLTRINAHLKDRYWSNYRAESANESHG